ncbi:MAG: MazG nucleotide pyrophosphohydrolase domain-containing protein [Nitrososphaerota archaeon]|nr:MazG nucleotide pyrophosphohydrolase domain-containing protein [Nitrososphaerota archaeon]
MDLKDVQDLMMKLYGRRDIKRGVEGTFIWLVEEIGELSEAIRKRDEKKTREEMADVLAWLFSLANVLNIDLSKCFFEKYYICPRCKNIPCICIE